MSNILRTGAACFAIALAGIFVACAESETGGRPAADEDAGALPPVDGATDAGPTTDGDADAAPRECSDDAYCHTTLPKNQTLRGVWGDGQGVVWAVSEQGAVLRWDGSTWKIHASGLGKLTSVWGSGPTDLWIGRDTGLLHGTGSSPGALTFAPATTPIGEVTSIWGTSASDVWAVLALPDDGSIPRSHVLHYSGGSDAGAAWMDDPFTEALPEIKFTRVWGSAATGVWLAGMTFDPDVFLEMGSVFRRAPGAATFDELDVPGHPDRASEFDVLGQVVGAATVSNTNMLLYARTSGGEAIFVRGTSTDAGQTFTWASALDGTFEDPATNAIIAVAPNVAWAVGEYGRIRQWDGTSWTHAAITVTAYPVIAPFYAAWASAADDVWFVGDDVALHLDPSKNP